jgi:hypothetical protein
MTTQDVERIAKGVLRELGAGDPPLTVSMAEGDRDCVTIVVGGQNPHSLTIRVGAGTSANFVREQIFSQFSSR